MSRTPTNAALRTSTIYIHIHHVLKKKKKKKNHNPDVKDVARKNVENTVRPGQTKFPTHLQVPSKQKSNRLQPYLQATPGAEDCTLSIPAIKCARGCLHPGSNPPTLKDMHVAVCTRSQTRAIIFLQPYRYFVSIAVAHETQTSSLSPDEADSSVICTDTAHPLTSFAPTNPASLSKLRRPLRCQRETTRK